MTERERQVFDALSAQCARREYCTADIRRKALERLSKDSADPSDSAVPGAAGRSVAFSLERMTDAAAAADAVVKALVAEGYVDDRRYAAAFARDKSGLAGWGPVKIRSALLARGVDRETVLEALEEIDADRAAARLEKVLEAKWRTLRDDPQGRLKLIRFALSRGYDYEPVRPLIERLTRPDPD
ncbi:MAG: RecX family transcriptional regulator [Bacteroidales bacterium]|jgi:regulatory protein|nr:RecX family transcriptional regulator [Bacteroidales bacterium]